MFLLSSDLDGVLGLQFPLSDAVFTIARQPTCADVLCDTICITDKSEKSSLYLDIKR